MNNIKKVITLVSMLLVLPIIASAAGGFIDLIDAATGIITLILIPLAFSLCLLIFFWGVAKYIRSVGQGKEEGKSIMVWGVVGLFVAVSVWGIINFIQGELNLPIEQTVKIEGY